MEVEKTLPTESFPMNGGNGRYSYVTNSSLQRSGVNASKGIIESSIAEKLDLINLPPSNTFRIADLGCSVGPNTFIAVQNIIEAIDLKYKSSLQTLQEKTQPIEYHVFFSDHAFNDFNTLFASLPERNYYAAGVPGSFYTRLFPKSSLHFVHSSFALQWLSKVPKEIVDVKSPAWNNGRIHYTNAPDEVVEAYAAQYVKDMGAFLAARAQEVVVGGLMALLVPAIPNGTPTSQATPGILFDILGACLMDMANMITSIVRRCFPAEPITASMPSEDLDHALHEFGRVGIVSEDKVDSFNLPVYTTSPQEVETLVLKNGCFSIEKMEPLSGSVGHGGGSDKVAAYSTHIRAGMEGIIKEHFGSEILDELFDRYSKKLEESFSILQAGEAVQLFVLLKRKPNA